MSADAIRYTIRGMPIECVQVLKAQKAHSGRSIGLLVADAVLGQAQSGSNQWLSSDDAARAANEMSGWGPVRLLDKTDDTQAEQHGLKHVSELDD